MHGSWPDRGPARRGRLPFRFARLWDNREGMTRQSGSLLFAVFSLATFFACSDSHSGGFPTDAGPETGSIKAGDGGTSAEGGKTKKDSGDTTTPPDDDSGTTTTSCSPGSVSSFSPQWTPPAVLHANACSATQITTLLDCLFSSSASQATCDAFNQAAANKSCITCAVTQATAASFGPLIVSTDNLVSLNLAGCIARTSNQMTATGCGAKVQASSQCTGAACEANCPVPDGDSQALQARNDCETAAESSVCQTYATDAKCADTLLQGASAPCAQGSTFEDVAKSLVTLFCGN